MLMGICVKKIKDHKELRSLIEIIGWMAMAQTKIGKASWACSLNHHVLGAY